MNITKRNTRIPTSIIVFIIFFVNSSQTQALPPPAVDQDHYVNASTGNNSNDCLSSVTACLTIYEGGGAVTKIATRNSIFIAAGNYPESIVIANKSLGLIGEDASNTIVDATGKTNALIVYGGLSTTVTNMTIKNADSYGIDVSVADTGLVARNIRVIDNSDTGIFANDGNLDLKNVEISGNGNRGLHINPLVTTVDVVNSTFSGNASHGIGTAAGATLNITNSTFANNGGRGLNLNNTTNIQNSLIYGNSTDSGSFNECYGLLITSLGNNLSGDNTCSFDHVNDLENTNPRIRGLAFNGASTKTHALLDASPAIDAGNNTNCPIDDQRGETRPFDGDNDDTDTCDIGAFEYRPTGGFNIIKAQNNNVIVVPL